MPVYRTAEEIAFLKRVDDAYRAGVTQESIASTEGCTTSALRWRVQSLGFSFARVGGLCLADLLLRRPLVDWLGTGEIAATGIDIDPNPAEAVVQ